MSAYKEYYQHPQETKDYDIVLDTNDSDTFDSGYTAVVQFSPATGDFTIDSITYNGATAKLWLTNGTVDTDYWVRVRLKTTLGRYIVEEFEVKIRKSFPIDYTPL